MTEHPRILQIIPAPPGLLLDFGRFDTPWSVPVMCLALMQHPNGATTVEPIDITGSPPDEGAAFIGTRWADTAGGE
ncbi:hypothetical protein [Rhodospira trueperi]|uniref:Uncharacterized protein n=1 Tax=Rhodospira trueperi TaxID=69960 RepID=A0A1G6X5A0_9PROT|nr:hypothetical protein [Rhodospira trueperi]SDD72436.1 hypothetical protein SAMN05421720_101354 [Rhodospira trueperi]